ncbi:hypothetical protein ABZY09_45405 [Streptomyces sp. NPDC002928]|uniref:hypothetical protein n=1 Tax=Streptomyces sp. NPDC002928 TaxID=3154440 RepID=UPI0033B65800
MASITSWTRLEPRARTGDLRPSLEGQVHDPAWMLARQWQLGEFLGDDAGSPVWVRVRGHADRITRYRPGPANGSGVPYDGATPLEALAEAEPAGPGSTAADLRAGAEAGQHLLRMLRAAGLPADAVAEATEKLLDDYPLGLTGEEGAADAATERYLAVLRGRVPDGNGVAFTLHASPPTPDEPVWGLPAEAAPVLQAWLAWYDDRHLTSAAQAPQTWDPQRLEHRFSVGLAEGTAETTLTADAYQGGTLDWTDFTAAGATGLAPAAARTSLLSTTFPAPVRFPGMPARRYWEFEDARVALGSVEAAPSDLARMLVAEFATVYGNDWYLVPLDVPVGSLTTVTSVVVGDTFSSELGGPTLLPLPGAGAGDAHWSLYRLGTAAGGRRTGLFVPPVTAGTLEGEPLEEVLFARDEGANLAWAVERRVPTPQGSTLDRTRTRTDPEPAPEHVDMPTYRLRTDVPAHWLPLVPVEPRPGSYRFRLSHLDGARSLGRLLTPETPTPYDLFAEEVPREGLTLTRTHQYTRTSDGRGVLWTARRTRPGRGESSSGLRFDHIEE